MNGFFNKATIPSTVKSTKKWLAEQNIEQMEWPSQSLDLNPKETLWHYLEIQIIPEQHKNIQELKIICKEEWK